MNDYSWSLSLQQDDYLEHFGIKGMKWGERNYEDYSGHLTAAGKARYGDGKVMSYSKYKRSALKGASKENGVSAKAAYAAKQRQIGKAGRQALTGAAMTAAGLYSVKKGHSLGRQAAGMLAAGIATNVALSAAHVGTKKADATLKSEYAKYKDTKLSELGSASTKKKKTRSSSGRKMSNGQKAALVAGSALSGYGLYKMATS